ncbi:MAG: hypothetical protein ACK56F_06090, partial [bacterium]
MSSIRKSARTPIVSEKLKESAGTKRAASKGGRKQAAFRAVNEADTLDSEAASNEEDDLHNDDDHVGNQGDGSEEGG